MTTAAPGLLARFILDRCLDFAAQQGLGRDSLLRGAGVSPTELEQAGDWLPIALAERVLHQAICQLNDPLIGLHISPKVNLAVLGVLGFAIQTSSTLKELIQTTIRLERLLGNVGTTSLQHLPGAALWQLDCPLADALVQRHLHEGVLASWAGQLRLLKTGSSPGLLAVHFQHEPLSDAALRREVETFFACPVHYSQPQSALLLQPSLLNAPLQLANPDLHATLEQHAQLQLRQQPANDSMLKRAHALILQQLHRGELPSREYLAQRLGMSGRNLHRKLLEEGSSFRQLLDDVRLDLAKQRLKEEQLSVSEVATQLGFQESQSFIRWFRRQAGTTPGDFRLRQ